jgi:hypothetical protein
MLALRTQNNNNQIQGFRKRRALIVHRYLDLTEHYYREGGKADRARADDDEETPTADSSFALILKS